MKTNRMRAWLPLCAICLLLGSAPLRADVRSKDDQLLALAKERLSRAKIGDQVSLKVDNTVATLEGSVASVGLLNRAAKEVAKVNGISSVANNLRVDMAGRSDNKILEEAGREIRCYAFYTIFDNVELEAEGGRLKLSGAVTQPWRREDIERLVSLVAGVKEVENNLEVLPLSPFDDRIRMRVALAVYRDSSLMRYGIMANPPIHIVVKNGSVTLTGVVANQMEKVLAERAARFATTYFDLQNQLVVEAAMAKKKP